MRTTEDARSGEELCSRGRPRRPRPRRQSDTGVKGVVSTSAGYRRTGACSGVLPAHTGLALHAGLLPAMMTTLRAALVVLDAEMNERGWYFDRFAKKQISKMLRFLFQPTTEA